MAARHFQSSLTGVFSSGRLFRRFDGVEYKMDMPRGATDLEEKVFDHLRDIYAARFPEYHQLRERYRNELRRSHQPNWAVSQLPEDWVPRYGEALTEQEQRWLTMAREAQSFSRLDFSDGKFEFRTQVSEERNRTNNSCIKVWYDDAEANADMTAAYGWIDSMFTHQAYHEGPSLDLVEADWADVLDELSVTGLAQVKWNAESDFNQNCCLAVADTIVPYNLVFLPQSIQPEDYNVADTYAVLDPYRKLAYSPYE